MSESKRGFVMVPDNSKGYSDSKIKTKCNGCVFAETLTTSDTIFQHGCSLGRIDKFRAKGTEVIDELDEDKNLFYVIDGRACNALRYNEAWPNGAFLSKDEQIALVKKEIAITAEMLILIDKRHTLEDVYKSVDDVYNMTFKPTVLRLVNNSNILPADLVNLIKNHDYHQDYLWQVHNMRVGGKNFVTPDDCIEFIVNDVKARYYAVFNAGYHIPSDYLYKINEALVEELDRFSLLESDNYPNGIFVSTALHKHPVVAGNAKVVYTHQESGEQITCNNVVEKVKFLAVTDEKPHMVKNVKEIVYV